MDLLANQHMHNLCKGHLAAAMLMQCTNEMEYLADAYAGNQANRYGKCKVWKGKVKEQVSKFQLTHTGIHFVDKGDE
jgi:hypothetical protein